MWITLKGGVMNINSRLKSLREHLNLTQQQMSEKLGITQATYSALEKGETRITDRHIKPICAIFRVNEAWLRYGEGKMLTSNAFEEIFAEEFSKLTPECQKYVSDLIKSMLNNQNSDDGG